MPTQALLDELRWRGLLYQHTEHVAEVLNAGPVAGYIGFDPTAASLHVGSLLQIMLLVHLQRNGHRPVALVGGGTGLIGDPSGRKSERPLASAEMVSTNTASIRRQLERFLDFDEQRGARMIDNAEWLLDLRAVDFMRDVGKHFTVNYMLQKESVKARLDEGISYTEFSYMLLQAYDYLELNRRHGVTLQLGGSDQWGNITAGMELIRRTTGAEVHGITSPLVTTSAGTKFGKTEAGAVWLDASMTSPYKFYQFWVNIEDRDAGRYLRYFTLFPRDEIDAFDESLAKEPDKRRAQYALARDVTRRVHGDVALAAAEEVSQLLFGGGDPKALSNDALLALKEEIPYFRLDKDGPVDTNDIIETVSSGPDALFKSKGDARRMIQQGGVYFNGRRVEPERQPLTVDDMLGGRYVLVRKGGRNYALVEVAHRGE
jgi:tyrosyl-tRNA synthetase